MLSSLGSLLLAFNLLGASAYHVADATVDLGTAGEFAILTKSGVKNTGDTKVTGHIGTSPIASTAITSFSLILDASNTFSTSSLVTGHVFAATLPDLTLLLPPFLRQRISSGRSRGRPP